MKKIVILLIVAVCLCASFAMAEEKLSATQKNLVVLPGENSGYFLQKSKILAMNRWR